MATFNSKPPCGTVPVGRRHHFDILAAGRLFAGEAPRKISAAFAKKEFERAQGQFQSDPNNPTNAWQFARAAFDLAEFSTNDTQRAALANQGIAACRPLVVARAGTCRRPLLSGDEPRPARAHGISWRAHARQGNGAGIQGGGRNWIRSLTMPGPNGIWACSIATRRAGRSASATRPRRSRCLKQAVKLAPDYPENHLHLIESYLKWNEPDDAQNEFARPRRHLAGGADESHRREMGAKLGQLVHAPRRRAKTTRRNPGTVKTPPN